MNDSVTPPQLWWSPSVGLVTLQDGVWWRYNLGFTSLRHDGLPNELPVDAVRLEPTTTTTTTRGDDE